MTRSTIFALVAIMLAACDPAAARELLGLTLPYGITPCDIFSPGSKYYNSDFSHINGFTTGFLGWGKLFQSSWCGSGGKARYTVLAATNEAIDSALAQLHAKYGTAANAADFKAVDSTLDYASNPVQIAWDAICEHHIIPFPVDFYTNKTVLHATKEKPLVVPTLAAFVHGHIKVWTEDGVVYGGIPNGLLHGDAAFVIPKPTPELTIGPYKKGDDSKIFIYPVKTLLVPHNLPIPFNNTWHSLHQMAAYLKEIGPCSTAYPPNYKGAIQAGCKPT